MTLVTWDSTNKPTDVTISNNDLKAQWKGSGATAWGVVRANVSKKSGKWYWEISLATSSFCVLGIINPTETNAGTGTSVIYYYANGTLRNQGVNTTGVLPTLALNDVVGIALDMDKKTIQFYKNGVSAGGTSLISGITSTEIYPFVSTASSNSSDAFIANFGASSFSYDIPKGYYSYDGSQFGSYDKLLISDNNSKIKTIINSSGEYFDSAYKGTSVSLTNSNKSAIISLTTTTVVGNKPLTKGKWYWEVMNDIVGGAMIGVTKDGENLSVNTYSSGNARNYYASGGKWITASESYGASYTTGDIISVLLDMDNGTLEFWKNGVSQGIAYYDILSLYKVRPSVTRASSTATTNVTMRSKESEFTYKMPSGYSAYGKVINKLKILPTKTEKDFIDYGINAYDITKLNFKNPISTVEFTENNIYTSLTYGKTFQHKLNLSKYKINKISFQ